MIKSGIFDKKSPHLVSLNRVAENTKLSLNEMFLCTKKMVFCKIVTRSGFVTKKDVTKSRLHCIYNQQLNIGRSIFDTVERLCSLHG